MYITCQQKLEKVERCDINNTSFMIRLTHLCNYVNLV